MPDTAKQQLRLQLSTKRDALSTAEIDRFSAEIAERLYSFHVFQQASRVMFFVSFRSEVRTMPMIRRSLELGKKTIVPATIPVTWQLIPCEITDPDADLAPGAYGILQPPPEKRKPVAPADIDLIIVPGLAFDRRGNRVGYGGGYYDHFMRTLRPDAALVSLAFSFQVIDNVPVGGLDRRIRYIITEKETIVCTMAKPATPY